MIPKTFKFKKQQKGRSHKKLANIQTLNTLTFGSFGLKTIEHGRLSSRQLKAMLQFLNKAFKKKGRIILKVFPHTPVTKKPIEVRMGKGKGNVLFWVCKLKAGSFLCEIETSNRNLALLVLTKIKKKLSLKTKIYFNL